MAYAAVREAAREVTRNDERIPRTADTRSKAPRDVARRAWSCVDAVLYLENAPFVTGEILHVDGGMSAGH